MEACTWSYTDWTPYEVLRVPSNASISDIRTAFKKMALCTHPDKLAATSSPAAASARAPVTFHAVKEASEILLDPFRRSAYDAARSHALVRAVGAVSDTFSLADDFDLVAASADVDAGAQVRVYQCECRCGGVYEVAIFAEAELSAGRTLRCECDSCSLVVEVVVE